MKRKLEKIEELDVNIDFDEASKCWRENKKVEINGMFSYICKYQLSKNKICGKPCYSKSINYPEYINSDITHMYCHKHFIMFLNQNTEVKKETEKNIIETRSKKSKKI
jgi:hypothetical protein